MSQIVRSALFGWPDLLRKKIPVQITGPIEQVSFRATQRILVTSPSPGGEGTSIAEGDPFDGDFSLDVTYKVISN